MVAGDLLAWPASILIRLHHVTHSIARASTNSECHGQRIWSWDVVSLANTTCLVTARFCWTQLSWCRELRYVWFCVVFYWELYQTRSAGWNWSWKVAPLGANSACLRGPVWRRPVDVILMCIHNGREKITGSWGFLAKHIANWQHSLNVIGLTSPRQLTSPRLFFHVGIFSAVRSWRVCSKRCTTPSCLCFWASWSLGPVLTLKLVTGFIKFHQVYQLPSFT